MEFPLYIHTYEVDGRVYRRNPYKGFRLEQEIRERGGDTVDLYGDDELYEDGYNEPSDDEANCGVSIERTEDAQNGTRVSEETHHEESTSPPSSVGTNMITFDSKKNKWSTGIMVPGDVLKFLIGVRGATKRKIEEETGCRLIIPERGDENGFISIISIRSKECVERCRDRIELVIMDARERTPHTHFIAIPMTNDDICQRISDFKKSLLDNPRIDKSCKVPAVYQPPERIHLTLVMLTLFDDSEQRLATETLEYVMASDIKNMMNGRELKVHVKGLEIMNDDPSTVRVLYAKAFGEKLDELSNSICKAMTSAGLAPRSPEAVKIHLTLMNARYADSETDKHYLNATTLLNEYNDFDFGSTSVNKIQILSLRGQKDDSGYYDTIATVEL
ncbi:hypothetical protein AB6A40_004772 [Gnathostoma spinigerum]|uniref:K Homology domain-containing protein n=1 Tax=Gnathostoma spinigerum TaxID=75299 RepID=A0ABD6EDN0_9BILA